MKEYTVSTISEYLDIIRNKNLKSYIFRGQNEPYYGIEASGFRPYKGGWNSDTFYNLNDIQKEYYDKIICQLTEDMKKHFISFCQHHQLPTNLVDFTHSPLVALFFACYGKGEQPFYLSELIHTNDRTTLETLNNDKSLQSTLINNLYNELLKKNFGNNAEVYLIDKNRLIDISDIIIENKEDNFFEKLIKNKNTQNQICDRIVNVFHKNENQIEKWLSNLIQTYQDNNADLYGLNNLFDNKNNKGISVLKKILLESDNKIIDMYNYLNKNLNDENIINCEFYKYKESICLDDHYYKEDNSVVGAKVYLALLINLLKIFENYKENCCIVLDIYFIYQPPNLFERISNQKGLFIYQPYMYYKEECYGYHYLNYQSIIPDVVIKINNWAKILCELDYLGINLETIYSDFDSIAKSIRYKHDIRLNEKSSFIKR